MSRVKTKDGRTVILPSAAEDAVIRAGIAEDADTVELDDEYFARARPAREVLGEASTNALVAARKARGRPPGTNAVRTKKLVSMRLDPEVVDAARATGSGWQTRVNELLRREFLKA